MGKTVSVIGLGSIGMRHAKNLEIMGHAVIGYDPSPDLKEHHAHDLEYVIKASDAIVIASPTSEHAFAILCDAHRKPMFIEKPIGASSSDAIEIRAALKHSKPMMVGYNLRFHSCVKKAKEWLDAGLIGEPLWANFTCAQYNDKPAYQRDGVILNWSHEIDLALYLLGPATVSASSTHIIRGLSDPMTKIAPMWDDMTDILLRHENGCGTTVHLDYLSKPETRGFTITGTLGVIRANLCNRRIRITSPTKDGVFAFTDSYDENYIDEMQAFIDRIDGKETIGCTGKEGLRVLEICLEVRKQAGLS